MSLKADVSSVSPSSERLEEFWIVCVSTSSLIKGEGCSIISQTVSNISKLDSSHILRSFCEARHKNQVSRGFRLSFERYCKVFLCCSKVQLKSFN